MAANNITINGKVAESQTGKGRSNHRIEAWSEKAKIPLGTALSNPEGEFQIAIDPGNIKGLEKGAADNLYFKVFVGKRLLLNTENSFIWNKSEKKEFSLEIEAAEAPSLGKDRIETSQIIKAASFLNESDFKGVYSDFRQRAGTSLGFIADMVMNSLTELDIEPVRVSGPRIDEIVNKEVELVQKTLLERNITVEEVRPYNPKLNDETFQNISAFPSTIKPGQRVYLFEENGKVRHYSIIREEDLPTINDETRIKKERENLEKIQEELIQTKKMTLDKDQQILKLQEEIQAIRKDQSDIKTILNSNAFRQFLKDNPSESPKKEPPRSGKKKPPE